MEEHTCMNIALSVRKKGVKPVLHARIFLGLYIVSETQKNWQWELFETIILQHRQNILEIIHTITFVTRPQIYPIYVFFEVKYAFSFN